MCFWGDPLKVGEIKVGAKRGAFKEVGKSPLLEWIPRRFGARGF